MPLHVLAVDSQAEAAQCRLISQYMVISVHTTAAFSCVALDFPIHLHHGELYNLIYYCALSRVQQNEAPRLISRKTDRHSVSAVEITTTRAPASIFACLKILSYVTQACSIRCGRGLS